MNNYNVYGNHLHKDSVLIICMSYFPKRPPLVPLYFHDLFYIYCYKSCFHLSQVLCQNSSFGIPNKSPWAMQKRRSISDYFKSNRPSDPSCLATAHVIMTSVHINIYIHMAREHFIHQKIVILNKVAVSYFTWCDISNEHNDLLDKSSNWSILLSDGMLDSFKYH